MPLSFLCLCVWVLALCTCVCVCVPESHILYKDNCFSPDTTITQTASNLPWLSSHFPGDLGLVNHNILLTVMGQKVNFNPKLSAHWQNVSLCVCVMLLKQYAFNQNYFCSIKFFQISPLIILLLLREMRFVKQISSLQMLKDKYGFILIKRTYWDIHIWSSWLLDVITSASHAWGCFEDNVGTGLCCMLMCRNVSCIVSMQMLHFTPAHSTRESLSR